MILNRYLMWEIAKPFVVVLIILVALRASYSAAHFLSNAVNGLLPTDTIIQLIGLKTLLSLEVLIPISLFISVVLSFGSLYSESEITVMFALGVNPIQVLRTVLAFSVGLAIIVGGLSQFGRPWVYRHLHELSRQAQATINFNDMEAGTFYENDSGRRVIFIGQRAGPKTPRKDVLFVQLKPNNRILVIHADRARQERDGDMRHNQVFDLDNAHIYDLTRTRHGDNRMVHVKRMVLDLGTPKAEPLGYSSKVASSAALATSDSPPDISEFQWRLSTPISTLLLGLLGVPLSRTRPRQGKYAKMGTTILIYSAYYLLCTAARNWVHTGVVPAFPGIWWAPALLALIMLIALFGIRPNFHVKL